MKAVLKFINGYKSYLVIGTGALIWFLEVTGIIPTGTLESVTPGLILAGGAAARSALKKLSA